MNHRIFRRKANKFSLSLHTFLVVLFLYIPIFVMIVFSFNDQRSNTQWVGFTTKWYTMVFGDSNMIGVIKNTLITSVGSTILAVIIGTLGAVGMTRFQFKGRTALSNVMYVPMVIPEIVLAVALLSIFSLLNIRTGLVAIIFGHTALELPFVYINVKTALCAYDQSIEEASMDLGANRRGTFFNITLPMIMPGILSGAFLAFSISLDDLIVSSFLSGADTMTLPVLIYSQAKIGISPEVNVLYTVIIFAIFAVIFAKNISTRKKLSKSNVG